MHTHTLVVVYATMNKKKKKMIMYIYAHLLVYIHNNYNIYVQPLKHNLFVLALYINNNIMFHAYVEVSQIRIKIIM